jgi:hypothetical protein
MTPGMFHVIQCSPDPNKTYYIYEEREHRKKLVHLTQTQQDDLTSASGRSADPSSTKLKAPLILHFNTYPTPKRMNNTSPTS